MSKRIIFCADGTWDSSQNNTNVYKMFKAIPIAADQVAFYDDGVGSDGTPLEKLAAGAFGEGLFQKIKDGYTKIAHVYEKDDDIFLFGFSRGAFTVRSLAGMIAICGLPTFAFDDNLVNTAFQAYRNRDQRRALLDGLGPFGLYDAPVKMVGVWDTVGSLGIPALFGNIDPVRYGFLDTSLHRDVLNAYQALAIDERRQEFPPTLWVPPDPPVPGQVLQQVWFAGVHCDVGGGYPETGLSDITFAWMLNNAVSLGLQIAPAVLAQYGQALDAKFALDTIHESWSPLWLFPASRKVQGNAAVGNSVGIRSEHIRAYQPRNLTFKNDALASSYQVVPVVTLPQV
jgi:uncharacterized protein (DUF2235 family)